MKRILAILLLTAGLASCGGGGGSGASVQLPPPPPQPPPPVYDSEISGEPSIVWTGFDIASKATIGRYQNDLVWDQGNWDAEQWQ